jgi:hypothetical protein
LETHWDTVDERHPCSIAEPSPCMNTIILTNVLDPIYVHTLP